MSIIPIKIYIIIDVTDFLSSVIINKRHTQQNTLHYLTKKMTTSTVNYTDFDTTKLKLTLSKSSKWGRYFNVLYDYGDMFNTLCIEGPEMITGGIFENDFGYSISPQLELNNPKHVAYIKVFHDIYITICENILTHKNELQMPNFSVPKEHNDAYRCDNVKYPFQDDLIPLVYYKVITRPTQRTHKTIVWQFDQYRKPVKCHYEDVGVRTLVPIIQLQHIHISKQKVVSTKYILESAVIVTPSRKEGPSAQVLSIMNKYIDMPLIDDDHRILETNDALTPTPKIQQYN